MGIAASFRGKNDLEVAGRKIAGLGIHRDASGGLLFHASLLLDLDVALMTGRGRLRGTLVSGESRNVYLRLAQFDRWRDDAFRLAFGRNLAARTWLACRLP